MSDEKSSPVVPTPEPSQEDSGALPLAVAPPAPVEEQLMTEAYQRIMQSTVERVEEAGEHLRELAALSTAASGVALRMMLSGEQPQRSAQTLAQAQQCLRQAADLFQRIGQVSNQLLERLQPLPSAPPAQAVEDTPDEANSQTERETVF